MPVVALGLVTVPVKPLVPVSGANAPSFALTWSGVGSTFDPLRNLPLPSDASATVNVASPAVLVTLAAIVAS